MMFESASPGAALSFSEPNLARTELRAVFGAPRQAAAFAGYDAFRRWRSTASVKMATANISAIEADFTRGLYRQRDFRTWFFASVA
jgi:hypothetical protein